ncbi:MAG: diguanylate cyclase [Elusimicrobia bacterium]|nr:diguanylate cyclase [Candidatus Obscuribacterium magneticum]
MLIVDDEPNIRENLKAGLNARGFDILTAADGEEALQMALRSQPDLILLDVMMPKMNGMTVCQRLKSLMGDFVPIIMVTAMGEIEDKKEGLKHGADDYLAKPFEIEDLVTRIKSMLRIKEQHNRLKDMAHTDHLTGIHNRRFLETYIEEEGAKAKREGTFLTCLMIDLDGFKEINDKFGHTCGDEVLKQVVKLFREIIDSKGLLARYGGDEFVSVLPETSLEDAKSLAERIRSSLERKDLMEGSRPPIRVACSIGICEFPNTKYNGIDELFLRLDEALYTAKERGRNCVTVYE